MQIAIVIPAYNEEHTIIDVCRRALEHSNYVIVVNDGSLDQTLQKVQSLSDSNTTNSNLILLSNKTNLGKAATLWKGMQHAQQLGIDAVITLDADGQHCPKDIPRFIEMAKQQPNNIIIGARLADKESIPAKRYYANKFANFWLSWAAGYIIDDSQSGFRLYPSSLIAKLNPDTQRSKSFVFESEVLIKASQLGFMSIPIKIEAIYNANARPSHFRGVTDILLITKMVAASLISRAMYPAGLFNITIMPLFKGKRSKALGADGIAMLLLSTLVIIATGGLSFLYVIYKTYRMAKYSTTYVDNIDALLLLGMRLKNNAINKLYQQRLDKAVELLDRSKNLNVIILGGLTGNSEITEAEAGKQYLLSKKISANRIITEQHSRHTLENLKSAKKLIVKLKLQKTALLTNRFHLFRATTLAKGFKIFSTPCAAENIFPNQLWNLSRIVIEAFFIHWYFVGKAFAYATKNKIMINRIS